MSSSEAKQYNRVMNLFERKGLHRLRQTMLAHVRGEILEIGTGTGVNLPVYNGASRITGIDVSREKLMGTAERIAKRPFTISVADAQQLPFADDAFDNVVGTLVFCSIPHPEMALAEVKRVLRPNGRLYLLEHVRGLTPVTRRLTDWLEPAWFALQGECHLNRETAVTVQAAGFSIEKKSQHGRGLLQMIQAVPE